MYISKKCITVKSRGAYQNHPAILVNNITLHCNEIEALEQVYQNTHTEKKNPNDNSITKWGPPEFRRSENLNHYKQKKQIQS